MSRAAFFHILRRIAQMTIISFRRGACKLGWISVMFALAVLGLADEPV
jgi:hypothetical protein